MKLKSKCFTFILILLVLFTITAISASDNQTEIQTDSGNYKSFEDLNKTLSEGGSVVNLENDYRSDVNSSIGITLDKNYTFTINGNNHIIENLNENNTLTFVNIQGSVIINNLTFKNCADSRMSFNGNATFNNVNFINCTRKDTDGLLDFISAANFDHCNFQTSGNVHNFINSMSMQLTITNSIFNVSQIGTSCISARNYALFDNVTFLNMQSNSAAAINFKGSQLTVKNSKFINLHSTGTGGAIIQKFFAEDNDKARVAGPPFLIENCTFTNVTSANDGGAIFIDGSGSDGILKTTNIINCAFTNCKSQYGGAVANAGCDLNIINSTLKNNYAGFEGGAIYTTWGNLTITNSTLSDNTAEINAGGIYFDEGKLTINHTNLTNNTILKKSDKPNAIYAYNSDINLLYSTFNNGGLSVYADFKKGFNIQNTTLNNDILNLNNTNYITSVENKGIKLNFIPNEINVSKLPSYYNAIDWGWTTPAKLQGDNDDCWTFATVAGLETSLYKATGIAFNISQNTVQQSQLLYSRNGDLRISLTGFGYSGVGYALSWYGSILMTRPYDDRGIIADTDFSEERIHAQDVMFIYLGRNDTMQSIKEAVLKYGAVVIQNPAAINDTITDYPLMDHATHYKTIIGWNDTGNGTGYWIVKDSMSGFANNPYTELSYATDKYAIVLQNASVAYIFENNIDYHVNYQTDLTALTGFDDNYKYYSNEFTSNYDELIGAVGTYFEEKGINYSFDIYVNDKLVHTQNGVSEYPGFRTIILNKYIPIKKGDKFKVIFKNNPLPYQAYSRQHYLPGMTFVSTDGKTWSDFTQQNKTVCLKVYTVADDTKLINNKDVTADYNGEKYFTVQIITNDGRNVGAGESVKFTINGKTTTVKTDNNGIAKIKITQLPKTYTIKTTYKDKTYTNKITVKQVLTAKKVTTKKTANKFTLQSTLKINGKLIKGKTITFKFNGKTYKAKTNAKGIAQVTVKKNIIKKLKKGKTYTVKVTYLQDTIKTTVKVSR